VRRFAPEKPSKRTINRQVYQNPSERRFPRRHIPPVTALAYRRSVAHIIRECLDNPDLHENPPGGDQICGEE
jgi:hypothetical protein